MISLPKVPLFACLIFAASASQASEPRIYRLLPVHHTPGHEMQVAARLAADFGLSGPDHYDIPAGMIPPVRDQGQRGSCSFFATNAILESYYMQQAHSAQDINLSEECVMGLRDWESDQKTYTLADKPAQRPDDDGDLPMDVAKTVNLYGVPLAQQYAGVDCTYNEDSRSDIALTDYLSANSGTLASFAYGKGLSFDSNTAPTINQIRTLISQNIPVAITLLVYSEYFNDDDWQYDSYQDDQDHLAGGHAVILTGYKTSFNNTIFTFKNSWGKDWANMDGYGTINENLLVHSWGYDSSLDAIVSLH